MKEVKNIWKMFGENYDQKRQSISSCLRRFLFFEFLENITWTKFFLFIQSCYLYFFFICRSLLLTIFSPHLLVGFIDLLVLDFSQFLENVVFAKFLDLNQYFYYKLFFLSYKYNYKILPF
jgi:hypothetical protein